MKAFIRVKAVDMRIAPGASRESLLRDATDELAQTSITLQRQWSELNDPMIAGIDGLVQAHESACVVQGAAYEVHFAVVRRDPILFCITALVLPMQLDALTCMRGHRAYAIALDSVAPLA